jgi:tetratricopeptide (TPR) repeat protein
MAAGIAAAQKGDMVAAQNEFARAVHLAPRIAATHAALGSILLERGNVGAAEKELAQAHALTADDIAVDLNLARAEVGLAHFDVAVRLFKQALSGASAPQLAPVEAVAYATALSATGDAAKAQDTLSTALQSSPDSVELQDALGTVLAQQQQLDEALPHFQRAVQIEPSLALAQFHLGTALLALGRPSDAIAPLQLAATARPEDFNIHLQLGRALSAMGQDEAALKELHSAVRLRAGITNLQALYALALALQASGDAAAALPIFADATQSASAWPSAAYNSALTNYALARVQTGDAKGALPLYAQALTIGPDSATLREDYGAAYLQQSDLDHAMEQFRAGLAIEPGNAHLHYDLGLALKLKDNLSAAIPEFERSAQLDATLPDPAYTLGVIYMQQGRFPDAAAQLKHAVALQPGNVDAWALLGSVLRESNDPAGAMDALKHAIALDPKQPSLHVQIAALEAQAGQKDEAAAERKLAAELSRVVVSRQRASFALKSGRALLAENKLDDAIVQLNNAVQADPTAAEPHQLLAEVYARKGNAADAALERQRAQALTPATQKQ